MNSRVAETTNLQRLRIAVQEILTRPEPEKIAIVSGASGTGKTTALLDSQLKNNAIRLEASPNWTARYLLHDLAIALGVTPSGSACAMERAIMTQLQTLRMAGGVRPLFIDEGNFIVEGKATNTVINLLGTLYRLHDTTGMPIVLFGLRSFPGYLKAKSKSYEVIDAFDQRVVSVVEFQPCSVQDAQIVADQCCQVRFEPEAIAQIHKRIGGSFRRLSVILKQLEHSALLTGLEVVSVDEVEALHEKA